MLFDDEGNESGNLKKTKYGDIMVKYKKVMLIDDDEDDKLLFTEAVKVASPASEMICFDNAEAGIKFLTALNTLLPDIIFLDLNMPRLKGKEFLQKIRSLSFLNHIPVIIYTTSDVYKDKTDSLKYGANGFLTKPRNFHSLCEKLGALI